MNISEYQLKAARTLKRDNERKELLMECCMGLIGEVGELTDHIKKHVFHGHELDEDYLRYERGDIFWYLAGLATAMHESLAQDAELNIEKLMKRYPEGFSEEMSRNRVEYEK